jgi:hypothetical protein
MTRTKKPEPPVTARQLRRHYALLSKVAEKALSIEYRQQRQTADLTAVSNTIHAELLPALRDLRAEVGERLRLIELELEQLGAVIPTLPRWTQEQREAFEAGDTDRMIRAGFKELARVGERWDCSPGAVNVVDP